MPIVEIDFTNVRPKPERLRFFICQFGIEAEYEFVCSNCAGDGLEVRSALLITGGVLTKMIPITAYREVLVLSEDNARNLQRETVFKTGETKHQQLSWTDLPLPSTTEAPWILESAWRELVRSNATQVNFHFHDGHKAVAGQISMHKPSIEMGSDTAKLEVESAKRFAADLEYQSFRLQSLNVEMPVIGKLRLNRRDG